MSQATQMNQAGRECLAAEGQAARFEAASLCTRPPGAACPSPSP